MAWVSTMFKLLLSVLQQRFIVQYFKLHVMPLEGLNGNEMWARLTLWCDHHLTQDAGWPHNGLLD
jgi:hypothetical protein